MELEFFDSNMYIGRISNAQTYKPALTGSDLVKAMDHMGIGKALVWHIAQFDYSVPEGNNLLSSLIKENDRLFGCWSILPPQTGEIPFVDEMFSRMKNERVFALRPFPGEHKYLLNRTVFGDFLDEVSKRKIPLMLSMQKLEMDYKYIYEIMSEYPDLTCILCDVGIWGQDRRVRPLVEKYDNLYVETSCLSIHDGVVEDFVNKYGPDRLVFGSAFPEKIPEASMLQLMHAEISDDAKRKIACENLEKMIGEVVL